MHLDVVFKPDVGDAVTYGLDFEMVVLNLVPIFTMSSPITPGAELNISWGVDTTNGLANGNVPTFSSATLDAALSMYQADGSLLQCAQLPTTPILIGGGPNVIQTKTYPNQAAQNSVYSIGAKEFRLDITVTEGGFRNIYSARCPVDVLGEQINSSLWTWTSPAGIGPGPHSLTAIVAWKSSYVLAGSIAGPASLSSELTVHAALSEAPAVAGGGPASGAFQLAQPAVDIAPLGSAASPPLSVPFAPITKDWNWFDNGTGARTGPIGEDFSYSVQVTFFDPFGNQYGPFVSAVLDIQVQVSQSKIAAQSLAEFCFGASLTVGLWAAIAGVFSFGIAGVVGGLGAAALMALSQSNIGTAQDPPEPSLNYQN